MASAMHGGSGEDQAPHSARTRPQCAGVEYQAQLRIHYRLIIWLNVFQSHFSSSLNSVQIFLFTCADRFSYWKELMSFCLCMRVAPVCAEAALRY